MELRLKNGDYIHDGAGGQVRANGAEEVLERVLFRLRCCRGSIPFLPGLGSELHLLFREKPSARLAAARQYVVRALEEESQVRVTDVALSDTGEALMLTVSLLWQGAELSVQTQIKGG